MMVLLQIVFVAFVQFIGIQAELNHTEHASECANDEDITFYRAFPVITNSGYWMKSLFLFTYTVSAVFIGGIITLYWNLKNKSYFELNKQPTREQKQMAELKRYDHHHLAMAGHGGIAIENGVHYAYEFNYSKDEPEYAEIEAKWISKKGGVGTIECCNWNGQLPVVNATRRNVIFYGCVLDPLPDDSGANDVTMAVQCTGGGVYEFDYTECYDHYIRDRDGQHGHGGCRLERHEFAHFETPLYSEDDNGYFILGKLNESEDTLYLTAFNIPRKTTLFVPGHTIHTNDYQRGMWRTYLETSEVDVCNLVNATDRKNTMITLKFGSPSVPRITSLPLCEDSEVCPDEGIIPDKNKHVKTESNQKL